MSLWKDLCSGNYTAGHAELSLVQNSLIWLKIFQEKSF